MAGWREWLRWQPGLHLPLAALAALVGLAYWPAFSAGFIWDDNIFYESPLVAQWGGLAGLWLDLGAVGSESHYWPLLYSSFWLDHKLWGGFNPAGFHFTNVLLHAVNAALLWRLLARLQVPGAWLIAALFALHPMRVESVAWVIARKDILATLFCLLAVNCWLRHRERPQARAYLGLIACYTLGLLSKTVAVTLPAALLALAWWRDGRLTRRDWLQMAPLFAIGLGIAWYGLHFFASRTLIEFEYSLAERVIIAAKALWFYAGKLVWPHPLHFIYHHWDVDPARLANWLPVAGAAALALALWLARGWIGRGPFAGALIFAITLSPMLGFADNSYMKFAFVADRYQYLPSIALLAVLAAAAVTGWRWLLANHSPSAGGVMQGVGVALAGAVLCVCGALTFQRATLFQDKVNLFQKVVAHTPGAYEAYYNLGTFLMERGRTEEAVAAFTKGLDYEPHRIKMYVNLSSALMELERREDAEAVLRRAAAREPADFSALKDPYGARYEAAGVQTNLGMVLMELQRPADAEAALRRALELDPKMLQAERNLAALLEGQGRPGEALAALERIAKREPSPALYFQMAERAREAGRPAAADRHTQQALAMMPDSPAVLNHRATLASNAERHEEALALYQRSADLDPDQTGIHMRLGISQLQLGRTEEARATFTRLLDREPENTQALNQLAALHFNAGRFAEAQELFRRGVTLVPNSAEAHSNLGSTLAQMGRLQEAVASFEHALELDPDSPVAHTNLTRALQKLTEVTPAKPSESKPPPAKRQNTETRPQPPAAPLH